MAEDIWNLFGEWWKDIDIDIKAIVKPQITEQHQISLKDMNGFNVCQRWSNIVWYLF